MPKKSYVLKLFNLGKGFTYTFYDRGYEWEDYTPFKNLKIKRGRR